MSAPGALTSEWARVVIESLAASGVARVVSSPGSRSTPFLWAALENPKLRVDTIVDERSAGFFALGQAKLSGQPSVLLCTSGSAAAHYYPAVIEASESETPLIVLSADRPLELCDLGAAQTIDQSRLYGSFARHFVELGAADAANATFEGLTRRIALGVARARGPRPGPVQLNVRARKPLEPAADASLRERADRALERAPRVFAGSASVDGDALTAIARRCEHAARGLVVCGPLPAFDKRPRAAAFARAFGFALLPEATSQIRFALDDPNAVVIAEDMLDLSADLVVQIGAAPVSSRYARLIAEHPEVEVIALGAHGLADPEHRASIAAQGPVAETIEALIERAPARGRSAWLAKLADQSAAVFRQIEAASRDGFGAATAIRVALDALPPDSVLVLGNSLPVRQIDRFCPPDARDLTVVSARGAAGIDGLVSTAAGVAVAAQRPTLLLVGDISLLHDVGGLWAARVATAPLVLLVLNNGGGRIFDELPIARTLQADARFAHWTTPHGFDLAHAAALYGIEHQRAQAAGELGEGLRRALGKAGPTLIEAVV